MLWALCALVVIGAGLPLTAWLATRGLARRPSLRSSHITDVPNRGFTASTSWAGPSAP